MGSFAWLSSAFRGYCEASSLHGWAYLASSDTRIVARLFWAAAIVVSFVLCGIVLRTAVDDWTVRHWLQMGPHMYG